MTKGDRVKWAEAWFEGTGQHVQHHRSKVPPREARGEVVGYARTPSCVRVRWDHRKGVDTIALHFLELDVDPRSGEV